MNELTWKKFAQATEKNYNQVVGMYQAWCFQRNKVPHLENISVDLDDVSTFNKSDMSLALCRFISETCRETGEEFPPKTI